ncbi:hypothetical protein [Microbacterium hydrocarbonoxydans]|uniref:hypothetical protein n=1 Tax=Microbacterium hydrocarbonoxydans TaxID=273678 RepID=UPI003D98E2C9
MVSNDVLWATSFRHLNDSQEADYATSVLQAKAEQIRSGLPEADHERFDKLTRLSGRRELQLFLLCAAQESNLLSVWRGYGGEISYAVELDGRVPLLPVRLREGSTHPSPPKGYEPEWDEFDGQRFKIDDPDGHRVEYTEWLPVRYDTRGVKARVKRIAGLAQREPDTFRDAVLPYMNFHDIRMMEFKNPDFRDEREARMIFDVHPRWMFVAHRHGKYGVTPYIHVSAESEDNRKTPYSSWLQSPGKLPIRSVTLGPTPLGDEAVEATREFLEFNGYPDVKVNRSLIPFR